MQKWEYAVITTESGIGFTRNGLIEPPQKKFVDSLDKAGENGWELVSNTFMSEGRMGGLFVLIFKRPIE